MPKQSSYPFPSGMTVFDTVTGLIGGATAEVPIQAILNLLSVPEHGAIAPVAIATSGLDIYFNATAGAIAQALPTIASLVALGFSQFSIRFWKTDVSTNNVTISSTDGFCGSASPLAITVQGASLTLIMNSSLGLWMVVE